MLQSKRKGSGKLNCTVAREPLSRGTRYIKSLKLENERYSLRIFFGQTHAASVEEAPRRRNVRTCRSRTIVLAIIASDIRKRLVRFREWDGFAYNDREIGYRGLWCALRADIRASYSRDDKASFRRAATKIDNYWMPCPFGIPFAFNKESGQREISSIPWTNLSDVRDVMENSKQFG